MPPSDACHPTANSRTRVGRNIGRSSKPTSSRTKPAIPTLDKTDRSLCVCSYEDRPQAMDSLILMGESLCRVDAHVSLHLTVPDAPPAVRAWAERRPEVVLRTKRPEGVSGWNIKPWLLLQELNAGSPQVLWLDDDIIVTRPVSALLEEFPRESLILAEEWTNAFSPPDTCGQQLLHTGDLGQPDTIGTLASNAPGPALS